MTQSGKNTNKHAAHRKHAEKKFLLGPDRTDDLRYCRPYFLIPLTAPGKSEAQADAHREDLRLVKARIAAWADERAGADEASAITDIFILSHGWHRNFFSGVAAYDRLASRLGTLLRTRRLNPTDRADFVPSENKNFHPLFLNLHWHSDPGEDDWLDKSGRRHKIDFLANAAAAFEKKPAPPLPMTGEKSEVQEMLRAEPLTSDEKKIPEDAGAGEFTVDFESLFELFSEMSAPGKNALSDEDFADRAPSLTARLDCYVLKDDGNAPFQDKVAVAWTCYHESHAKGVLLDQDEKPARSLSFLQAVSHLVSFLVKILGIATVLGLLLTPFVRTLGASIVHGRWVQHLLALPPVQEINLTFNALFETSLPATFLRLGLISLVILSGAALLQWNRGANAPSRGVPLLAVVSWAYLQVWAVLPIVVYLLVTYPLGFLLGVFDPVAGPFRAYQERVGRRNSPKPGPDLDIRYWLAELARLPLRGLQCALADDSAMLPLLDTIDSQLAFYLMQRRGVETGTLAAKFLEELLEDTPSLSGARLHFQGHSFGGLVVVNAARQMAFRMAARKSDRRIHSLCLLEAALASDWFVGETTLCSRVNILASIFSRYDTANGYIYPVANQGKPAAGFVGLYGVPDRAAELQGRYATLVRPPDFGPPESPGTPRVLNVDASRVIYFGPVAAGGGHDDIFKDDVIYLTWAIAILPPPDSPAPPRGTVRYADPHRSAKAEKSDVQREVRGGKI